MSLSRLGAMLAVLSALALISADFADARVGRGGSFGSRGSRTFSAPPPTNTAPKTAASITVAANTRVAVRGFSISFDGVSSTAGAAEVQLVIHSSSGTASAMTLTKTKRGTTEALGTSG